MATYFSEKIKDYQGLVSLIEYNNIKLSVDDILIGLHGILSNLQCEVKDKIKELNNKLNQPYKRLYNQKEEKLDIEYGCDSYICEILRNNFNNK